jgi:gas vesicle protein
MARWWTWWHVRQRVTWNVPKNVSAFYALIHRHPLYYLLCCDCEFILKEVTKMTQVRTLLVGLLAGALAGVIATLLLAPQSGEETRTQIREKGDELKDMAETRYTDLQERLDSTATELRAEMEKLSARVEEALPERQEAVALE